MIANCGVRTHESEELPPKGSAFDHFAKFALLKYDGPKNVIYVPSSPRISIPLSLLIKARSKLNEEGIR